MEHFMSRFVKLSTLCVAAGVVSACNNEPKTITTPDIPTAGVRFLNAVPDTGALDFRFVDMPENSAHFAIPYRNNVSTAGGVPLSVALFYKNTQAGQRHFKIFLNSTNQALAQIFL